MNAGTIPHDWHWYHNDYAACVNCNRTRSVYTKDEPCNWMQGSPAQRAQAQVLLSRSHKWARGYDKRTGIQFVMFASSRMGKDGQPVFYRTRIDGQGCTCEGARRYPICSHQLACRLDTERAREAAARKPLTRYEDLMERQLSERTGTVAAF